MGGSAERGGVGGDGCVGGEDKELTIQNTVTIIIAHNIRKDCEYTRTELKIKAGNCLDKIIVHHNYGYIYTLHKLSCQLMTNLNGLSDKMVGNVLCWSVWYFKPCTRIHRSFTCKVM